MTTLPGAMKAYQKDGTCYYRSSLTYRNKHISLGSYATENQAHQAYREAGNILRSLRIQLSDFTSSHTILRHNKWVSLINFRDNGIYIKTPIYLYKNFFHYYLDAETCLTFDIDDLFYYSRRTIMRRGNHLFVSEFGMQVNLLTRYGIRSHSVPGRDYFHVNGDNYDYRYANLRVINAYFGVRKETFHGKPCYTTRVHINGDWIVGRYNDEKTAAIAYNKATDTIREYGLHRNFPSNYLEEYSPAEYLKAYQQIQVMVPPASSVCEH